MSGDDRHEILKRLRDNDKALIVEITQLCRRVAQKFNLHGSIGIDDVAQDVWLAALEALTTGKFEGRSSFRTYVYTIARRTCIKYVHRLKHMVTIDAVELPDETSSPERSLLRREQWQLVRKVVGSLPPKCQQLWRLLFVEEMDYGEVANLLQVKPVTIRSAMSKCCKEAEKLASKHQ